MTPKERLKAYLHHKKITQQTFASSIGASSGYVNALARGFGPQFEPIVMEKYPDLNIGWVMTGQGLMLNEQTAGDSDATQNTGTNHTDMEKRLLEALERRDRDVDRLLSIIERMQHIENESRGGGDFESLKKEA